MGRFGLIAMLALLTASCVGNRPYRIKYESPASLPYRLRFVEFDDRGEMFDRSELASALAAIRDAKADALRKNTVAAVVVFVHGWKHNAGPNDDNVRGFGELLKGLTDQFGGAPVTGIYIGWRGAVVSAPVLKELTFWDRRDKSQNLPNAHMVETLLSILHEAKGLDFKENTVSILIGHSFGGALLESAMTQTLEGAVLAKKPGEMVTWPADLTIFINSASPATQSYQLIESMLENVESDHGCPNQVPQPGQVPGLTGKLPVLMAMTSTGDSATRVIFPLGQAISRPLNSLRHYSQPNAVGLNSQVPMYLNSTANLEAFRSHLLGEVDDPSIKAALSKNCGEYLRATISKKQYVLLERPNAANRTPYWVFQLPASIVPSHSEIFGQDFRELLIDFALAPTVLRARDANVARPGPPNKPSWKRVEPRTATPTSTTESGDAK